ncbi:MAG: hypothetical protein JWM97_3115 [Phycisphaerales bacterium]|nr:hypothetical protein [Phycisphaerales bacterium]
MPSPAKTSAPRPNGASTYVALLRGINVGGKNMLPMTDLAKIFAEAGCARVRPYIQSGNVVFVAKPACAKRVGELVSMGIGKRFGFNPVVVIRTADELAKVAATNPFLASGADVETLHVAFLADAPNQSRVELLDPQRSPGDLFTVLGREIYLSFPNGVGKSRLTNAYFDSKLATTSTVRNWRTVLKLVEMTKM